VSCDLFWLVEGGSERASSGDRAGRTSVDDALAVQRLQRARDLAGEPPRLGLGEGAALLRGEPARERARAVLEHHVHERVRLEGVVEPHEVRARHPVAVAQDRDLLPDARGRGRGRRVLGDDLHRHALARRLAQAVPHLAELARPKPCLRTAAAAAEGAVSRRVVRRVRGLTRAARTCRRS